MTQSRRAAIYYAQKSATARFMALTAWAVRDPWAFQESASLLTQLKTLARSSDGEDALSYLNWCQQRSDRPEHSIISQLKRSLGL